MQDNSYAIKLRHGRLHRTCRVCPICKIKVLRALGNIHGKKCGSRAHSIQSGGNQERLRASSIWRCRPEVVQLRGVVGVDGVSWTMEPHPSNVCPLVRVGLFECSSCSDRRTCVKTKAPRFPEMLRHPLVLVQLPTMRPKVQLLGPPITDQ